MTKISSEILLRGVLFAASKNAATSKRIWLSLTTYNLPVCAPPPARSWIRPCTSLCEEGRRKIILLLFQSEAGISGLDGRRELWDSLNQNLMVSMMVCVIFR